MALEKCLDTFQLDFDPHSEIETAPDGRYEAGARVFTCSQREVSLVGQVIASEFNVEGPDA